MSKHILNINKSYHWLFNFLYGEFVHHENLNMQGLDIVINVFPRYRFTSLGNTETYIFHRWIGRKLKNITPPNAHTTLNYAHIT